MPSLDWLSGLQNVVGHGEIRGDLVGVSTDNVVQKVWLSSQAVGDIAFAFTYNIILFEIEDTLGTPPPEKKTMKEASTTAILITSLFIICCGCFGYAAFGKQAPGNLLTGFGFYEPYWLVDLANAGIVLHLVGGYQPAIVCMIRKMDSKEISKKRICERVQHYTPITSYFQVKSSPFVLQNYLRCIYNRTCCALSLLQPSFRSSRGLEFFGHIFPRTDISRAGQDKSLNRSLDSSSSFQDNLLDFHCSIMDRVVRGTNKRLLRHYPKDKSKQW